MKQKLITLFFALAASVGTMFAEQITVAQALQIAGQLEQGAATAEEYEVVGYVTAYAGADAATDGGWSKYSNQTFWIADEKGTAASNADGALEVYQGVPSEMVYVGDKVSVKATLMNYKGLLETTKRGVVTILEKVERPEQPVVEPADVVISGADFVGQGTAPTGSEVSVTKDGVTFTCDKGYSDDAHSTLRCYKNSIITISSTGEQIGKLVFQFYDTYTGDLDEEIVVNAQEWEATLTSQARIEKVSIYFGKYEEIPVEELTPITVAEALTIAQALSPEKGKSATTAEKYAVMGVVVGISATKENTFYLADEVDAYPEFQAYKCSSVDREVSEGDIVIVTGRIQHYYGEGASGEIHSYEISGGKLVHFGYNTITIIANNGNVTYSHTSALNWQLTATPDYGYHFVKWSDGVTDNPRTIVLTQDTTFTAEFAKNSYTISTTSANLELGTTSGDTTALYLDEVEISAIPNYGYRFVRWNDGNTSNPRTVTVTTNETYTATFAKDIFSITKNAEHGTISGNSTAEYLDFVTLTVVPDYGYHFTQWSDGLKDNPRIFRLTQDTTFTAEFAYDRVGQCGKDLALVWSYDPANKVLTIGNAGEFTDNMQFGAEAPAEMEELVIGNNVTAIGEYAFAGISTLKKVTIGESVKTIYDRAFYNCVNLETIFNYRPTPTNTYSTAFDGVDKFECILYVLPNSIDMYKNASVWRDFYYTYAIGAEEATVTTNDVKVEPQDNAATLTWPTSNEAFSYTIEITKDGVVFCRLTFNANGQLTGIAFAPERDGQSMAPAAVMTANGLQFTVTGLDSNTRYGYSITATDANEQPIATYSGSFTTTSEGVVTGIGNTAVEQKITKILRNGEVLILRDGKTYTLQGVEVK